MKRCHLQSDRERKTSYDIAHIHSGSITALAYCAREASKAGIKRVIVHSHSSGVNDNWKHKLIKAYAAPLYKKYATDYCACSVEAAAWKFPSGVMSKVKILNNGVDAEFFSYDPRTGKELKDKYGINEKTLVLGHIGRFTYEKNQAFLLDVLKAYLEDHPQSELMLVLIGEGPDKPGVEEKANNLGLKQSVLFPAEYDKVRDYMQMFDVFLFPSLFEGLGIVGIEAQAAGVPVVASTGVPKAMQLAENVKFVSLEDMDAWCKAIDSFREIQRQDQREQIRDRGFDIRDTAKEVEKLYRQM